MPDTITCPNCGLKVEVINQPEEKPDGNLIGYLFAQCECEHDFEEDEIFMLLKSQ